MQANLNPEESLREGDTLGDINGSVPFSHHDRNHSLPNTSLQTESGVPLKVKLNRAATVSKTENLNQFPFHQDLSTFSESFQPNPYGIQTPVWNQSPGTVAHPQQQINTAVPNGGAMPISHPIPMPIVDLGATSISIPDLHSNTDFASPLSPSNHYEDPSMRSLPSNSTQSKAKGSSEGKNPSEYALHILFTQVCFCYCWSIITFY